ncbi:MAG: apolipoprotein N-acyltransferase [Flavobacteriales bacterium]|nr:apolipoprotein N-acyltransferase [Bacteroidota bacterium]MCB9240068.1 apolipoprotein N-acyltransferase [Flavobacteriales bacterium]
MRWILVFLVPLLGWLAWPPMLFSPLLFFLFVPILMLDYQHESKGKTGIFFVQLYIALLLFNTATTWWVWNASPGGSIFMLLANSLLMTLPVMGYRFTRQVLGISRALLVLPMYWLSYEFLHHRWDLAYPWLTLGNAFAATPDAVQWYEFTGVLGGSLWIWGGNLFIFQLLRSGNLKYSRLVFGWLIIPIIASVWLKNRSLPEEQSVNLVVIQPNIDPYNDKFQAHLQVEHVRQFLRMADSLCTDSSDLIVLPETAIVEYLDEDEINDFTSIHLMREFCGEHPGTSILTGASTYRWYREGETPSVTARQVENVGRFYDSYNTALLIDSNGVQHIYHKSRLVPGVERMPYPGFFQLLTPLAIDMGGISGSLGSDDQATNFEVPVRDSARLVAAPLICYESIFGEYVGDFVRTHSNLLFVITNDGWWGNTPGYRQHMHYARLRAIEYRRFVVRSANTGVSCVIDPFGGIDQPTNWWEPAAFHARCNLISKSTYYARNGDYLGRIAVFLSLFFFLSVLVKRRLSVS